MIKRQIKLKLIISQVHNLVLIKKQTKNIQNKQYNKNKPNKQNQQNHSCQIRFFVNHKKN